jgi:thiol:disulfide interchange protein DsbD
MKKLSFLFVFFSWIGASFLFAQPNTELLNPVKWTFELGEKVGDHYELKFIAKIDKGWHVYSHFIGDEGPIPTNIIFEDNNAVDLKEKFKEVGTKITKHDKAFDMELSWFENQFTIVQKAKLLKGFETATVKGEIEFMVCDDEQCLPPDYIPFSFVLGAKQKVEETEKSETNPPIDISSESPLDFSQLKEPTKWSYRVTEDGQNLKVEWKVLLDKGWYIYSQNIAEGGPLPTEFIFDKNSNVAFEGKPAEFGDLIKKREPIFDNMELLSYKDQVIFAQQLKWIDTKDSILSGTLDYMVCEEACIPGGFVFKINLGKQRGEWLPFVQESVLDTTAKIDGIPAIMQADVIDKSGIEKSCTNQPVKKKGYWVIFILGFGGGLIALLTPCVFPMIPLTVSFFTKGADKASADGIKNAFIYGISIIVIYVVMTMSVILTLGPFMLNWISTDAIFNIVFFLIFVFFAFSFFGYYEITLPSSWANKTDKLSAQGGLIGIFFMAFTLALVSFSCTGPIIGSLILGVVQEGIMGPLFGMLGFSLALALPFTLFAIFPKWLNSLPKSGGWLNSVKVFLGFLELAFALKFFSVADLTKHFGILKYELFIGLWIIIFILLALYMFGIIHFPHDSKNAKSGPVKNITGVASLAFAAYLVFGLVNYQPLLGGIAPAPGYSFFRPAECPQGVNICFHDYEEGMTYAKSVNQPVLLDFTGHGCVNCRLMENNVWTKKDVNAVLNKYVVISLYVDDRTDLPESEHYVSETNGRTRKIDKVGKYWVDFQTRHFNKLSQPYYVLLSPDGEVLNTPVAYTPNSDKYIEFLECGLSNLAELSD